MTPFDDIEAKKIITELNNKRVIVDYTDDYLHISSSKSSYYRELTKSSIFVTPVEELTQKLNLIGVPAHTIPDGIDDYGVTKPNVHKHDRPELLWFGHKSNMRSLVKALSGYLNHYQSVRLGLINIVLIQFLKLRKPVMFVLFQQIKDMPVLTGWSQHLIWGCPFWRMKFPLIQGLENIS